LARAFLNQVTSNCNNFTIRDFYQDLIVFQLINHTGGNHAFLPNIWLTITNQLTRCIPKEVPWSHTFVRFTIGETYSKYTLSRKSTFSPGTGQCHKACPKNHKLTSLIGAVDPNYKR